MKTSLRSIKDMLGSPLEATDGDIGMCGDFLLDAEHWTVRYLVAETHKWLPGRKVLISPYQFGEPELGQGIRHFRIALTRQMIKDSPPLGVDAPVSRRHERDLAKHYLYPAYWGGAGLWGDSFFPAVPVQSIPRPELLAGQTEAPLEASEGHRLRSARVLLGTHLAALDGAIGHLEDFVVETPSWKIRWMIVDTRNWLPGRKVILSPDWIEQVDDKVSVELTTEEIRNSPEFDSERPVNRDYEGRLYDYYGRPAYW